MDKLFPRHKRAREALPQGEWIGIHGRIFDQRGPRPLISTLTLIEFESVLAIKSRTGEIDHRSIALVRRRFQADLGRQRLPVTQPFHEGHFQSARKLVVQYEATQGLRTLDALQLAMNLDLRLSGIAAVLVAADQRLCRVALLTGCSVVNPEQPSTLVI